jgi:ribosomal-protein-alanine N-acetyltransferase
MTGPATGIPAAPHGDPAGSGSLREMHWRDIDALVELDAMLFTDDAWSAQTWWAELAERPAREYVVAAGAGGVTAYGGVALAGDTADVMTIAVVPQARGQGLGDAILTELEARALRRGATHALLEVRADNRSAQRLYARHGWRELHRRARYYQPGDVDALVLGKALRERGSADA